MASKNVNASLKLWAENLRVDAIDEMPRDQQWSGEDIDYTAEGSGGSWEFWEGVTCEGCGRVHVYWNGGGNEPHKDADDETECAEHLPAAEGPMMSYWYPCPIADEASAARELADLPLCVVKVDGETGIALTGGGMDLSWEICEAYTRLGYLPPIHYAGRLPRTADRMTDGRRRVLVAAKRAAEIRLAWATRALEDITNLEKSIKEMERKRAKGTK
jgi:hypothetical protein